MSNERREKRKKRRKSRRIAKLFFNLIILAIIIYLVMLAVSIFGGGGIPSKLRGYEFIDVPAQFIEESLDVGKDKSDSETVSINIVVKEEKIYFNDEEIAIEDLSQIVSEHSTEKAELIDDNAKRVTYAEVYNELERLGLIIEEK